MTTTRNGTVSHLAQICLLLAVGSVGWGFLIDQTRGLPASAIAETSQEPPYHQVPIENVRLGQRVMTGVSTSQLEAAIGGTQPPAWDTEAIAPEDWRQIDLTLPRRELSPVRVSLVRPISWVNEVGAAPGTTVFLNLHELGVEGDATVTSVCDCPPIADGCGQVVTGRFIHERSGILNLEIDGIDEPLGVTNTHRMFSVDRGAFVSAGSLAIGETLQLNSRTACVLTITPDSRAQTVYNLEVHADHVFRVTSDGVLVHNNNSHWTDAERVVEAQKQRRIRRENNSRQGPDGNGQKLTGEGYRTEGRAAANKGKRGERPKGPGGRNRERNIGIDDEHGRVAKGTGGGQQNH